MRSNKSNATRFLLRRHLFIGVIVFLIACYMMPVWGLSHIPYAGTLARDPLASGEMAAEIAKTVSTLVLTDPLNLEMMVILYGGLGFLTAMMLMGHLFSRRQSMLQAALPDRRETDFLRRCVGYGVLCLAPIVINFLLYLLVVAANGLLSYVMWDRLLPKLGMLLLINFYGFAMGMLCSVLTGTWWAALLAGAVLIVGLEGLAALWYCVAGQYLHTLVGESFTDLLLRLSPAYTLYKGFYRPAEYGCWPGVIAAVLALVLSLLLYRVRRTERAERTLAFDGLQPVLSAVLSLLGGTILGMVLMLSFTTDISLVVGMVLGAVLTFWVCQIVFAQRLCGILRHWALPAASAAVLVLGWAVLYTDALGYDRYLPARGELTAISYVPRGYDSGERITLTGEEALDAAYTWCTLMQDEVGDYDNGTPASTAYGGSDVIVTYQMAGRRVYRHYPNNAMRTEAQDSLKRIVGSDDYRQSIISQYQLDSGCVSQLYINTVNDVMDQDAFFEKFNVRMLYRTYERPKDGVVIDLLLEALRQDILNRSLEDIQERPLLNVNLYIEPQDSSACYEQMYIYPGDTHFLSALFGEQTEEVVRYASGGYVDSEDIAVLKVDYTQSYAEIRQLGTDLRDIVKSVTLAGTPQEARQWMAKAQETSADQRYYMPYREDQLLKRLHIYQMSTVERYAHFYGYKVPEDKTELYANPEIPVMMTLDYVGED
ncbi:MAG: hypothetical protein ACI4MP_08015 [Candidatus Ventricola sp.]